MCSDFRFNFDLNYLSMRWRHKTEHCSATNLAIVLRPIKEGQSQRQNPRSITIGATTNHTSTFVVKELLL